jgi:autophagy-related protein 27
LILELSGGAFPLERKGKKQKAIIEFLCDPDTDGTDTDKDDTPSEDDDKETEGLAKTEDEKKGKESPMKFVSYKDEKVGKDDQDWGVLRISWSTKYACENAVNEPSPNKGSSWGFFTWFIIM